MILDHQLFAPLNMEDGKLFILQREYFWCRD